MFQTLKRDLSAKKITAVILFGIIILVFVFFGMSNDQLGMGVGYAGRVNNTLISVADLRNETDRMVQFYNQMFGGKMDLGQQRQFIQQRAIENLINTELVAQIADKEGVLSTDVEVRDLITTQITAFQKDGKFQRDYYKSYLENSGIKAGDFENKIRKDRLNNRIRHLFEVASQPLQIELQKIKELQTLKTNVEFVKIDKEALKKTFKVDASQVQASLKEAAFAEKVKAQFAATQAELNQPEQVKAQHILIRTEGVPEAQVQAKLKEVETQLNAANFGQLAKKFSEDPGSKEKNGDLGFFSKGQMVPEFEQAAFEAPIGKVIGPIKSAFGHHFIKVNEKKAAVVADYAKFENQIAQEVLAKDQLDQIVTQIEQAAQQKDYTKVLALIQTAQLKWEETGLFGLDVDAVPKLTGDSVVKAAFSVSQESPYSDLIRDGGVQYFLKFKESKVEASTAAASTASMQQISQTRSAELLGQTIEGFRKSAKVETNAAAIQ